MEHSKLLVTALVHATPFITDALMSNQVTVHSPTIISDTQSSSRFLNLSLAHFQMFTIYFVTGLGVIKLANGTMKEFNIEKSLNEKEPRNRESSLNDPCRLYKQLNTLSKKSYR